MALPSQKAELPIFSRTEFDYIKSTHREDDREELRSYLSWNDLNRNKATGRITDSWSFITGIEGELGLREGSCTSANISLDLLHSIRGESCILQYGLGLDIPIYDSGSGFGGLDGSNNANDPTLFFSVGLRF